MRKLILILIAAAAIAGCVQNSAEYRSAADAAMKAGGHDAAVKQYEAAIGKSTHMDAYYANRADIHYFFGYYGEAVNDYTRAIRIKGDINYHMQRGRSYLKLHFYKDAIIDFSTITDRAGAKYPVAYLEKGKAYVAVGDFKEALKNLEKAKNRGGESVDFYVAMGELNFQMGRTDEAKAYVQKAVMKDSNNPELYYLRAKIFYKAKDANQAVSDLEKALSIDPANLDAKRQLAWIYATNPLAAYRNGERALKLALQLYEKDNDLSYIEVVAAAYAETGDFDKAISTLEEGIRLSSDLVLKEEFRFDIKSYERGETVRTW